MRMYAPKPYRGLDINKQGKKTLKGSKMDSNGQHGNHKETGSGTEGVVSMTTSRTLKLLSLFGSVPLFGTCAWSVIVCMPCS